jgi:hypothetical protein
VAKTFSFHCTMHRTKVFWSVEWQAFRWELPGRRHFLFHKGQLFLVNGNAWWLDRFNLLLPCLMTLSEAIAYSWGWTNRHDVIYSKDTSPHNGEKEADCSE